MFKLLQASDLVSRVSLQDEAEVILQRGRFPYGHPRNTGHEDFGSKGK